MLGDRYKGDRVIPIDGKKVNGLPDAVLDAMKETVDILSVEYYRPSPEIEEDLARWHARTGKPVLVADSAFLAPTDVLHPAPGTASTARETSGETAVNEAPWMPPRLPP